MARTTRLDRDALDQFVIQQLDVIARYQALAAGLSENALRHRLRPGGPWRKLLPGVYLAMTGTPTTLQQEMAALLYAGNGISPRRITRTRSPAAGAWPDTRSPPFVARIASR